jgi:serine/threonine protein kinase/tetratricopeptide (TPR) repeat protein
MVGKTISHYKILEKLGGGGMGIVYKAQDLKLDRFVALKFLPPYLSTSDEEKQRFIHEAKAASSLQHNNICAIHEIDETPDNQLFIVMDYYEGETLKKKIETKALKIDEAIEIAIQVAEGLQKAHQKGIIHRDIKPANIFITEEGIVKILDFGLAKLAGQSKLTKASSTLGTVYYMSPEQTKGEDVDQRSDIWSLGVIFYEMLSGTLPFKGDYDQAIIYSILNEEPESLTTVGTAIPIELERIINKALAKNPDERYQDVNNVWMELCDIKNEIKNGERLKAKEKKQHRKIFKMPMYVRIFLFVIVVLLIVLGWESFRQRLGFLNVPEEKHLAIIPFNNIVGDSLSQIFIDGLMETLTSKLTELQRFRGSLWIVPNSELRKQNVNSPSDALRFFGVTLAITGSVQCVKEMITLTLNLVDVKSLRQMESFVIEDRLKNMPAVKDKVIDKLAKMLEMELEPLERQVLSAGESGNSDAYNLYLQGQGYLLRYEKLSNVNTAISLFQQALIKDSQYALAYAGLAKAYLRKYQIIRDVPLIKDAVNYCNKALRIENQLALVHLTLGMIYEETGRSSEAIEEFRNALEINPVYAEAFMGLAQSNEAIGRYEEAEKNYRRAIEIQPGYWAGYNKLGAYYYRQSRYEDAIEQFRQVTILTPDNVRGFNNMGSIYFYIEQWDKACEEFEKSLQIEPNYTAYSNLGTLYFYQGHYTDAAKMLEHAVEISGENYKIWGNLASCYYWSENQREMARKTYNMAIDYGEEQLSVNANDPEVLADLAGYYATLGNREKATNLLDRVVALIPIDYSIIFQIGEVYEQLGERDLALEYIELALKNGFSLAYIENNPELQGLKNDIRFKKMLQQIGK